MVPNLIGLEYNQALAVLAVKLKIGRTYPEGREGFQGKIIDQFSKKEIWCWKIRRWI